MYRFAFGYARVSTTLVEQEGSLEVQEARIRKYCEDHHYYLLRVYKDTASGKNSDRKEFQEMLEAVQPGFIVVVCDLSRFSRSVFDGNARINELLEKGVGFTDIKESINTTTANGKLLFNVQLSVSEWERMNTAEKVSGAMKSLSAQGKLRGRPPFGWMNAGKDRDFEPVESQQRVLEKIKQLHQQGMTPTRIAALLNQAGDNKTLLENKRTQKGDPLFYPTTIKRILVENGLIQDEKMKRKPVQQQIVSHHKPSIDIVDDQK